VSVYEVVGMFVYGETTTVTPLVDGLVSVTPLVDGLIDQVRVPVPVAVCETEIDPPSLNDCVPGFANTGADKIIAIFVILKVWTHEVKAEFNAVSVYEVAEMLMYGETTTVTPLVEGFVSVTPVEGLIDQVRVPVPIAVCETEIDPPPLNDCVPGFANVGILKTLPELLVVVPPS
jgi:hypothetical protein